MKKRILILFVSLFVMTSINAQSITGKWKTIDDDTGKEKSVVEIYKKGGKYYGKVISIVDPKKRDKKCEKCTDYRKDKPVLGMEIIKDLEQDDDEFEDGTIMDPENGKIYDCKIWLEDKNTLNVRGYIAFFYRTQEWLRVE
ncbi:MAG: hypothetical protein COB15_11370 [Flavobacteriales bacterium]|nr:MAG: hypothetical protein COB15_11370 [Flavobacteriales bacterium]